MNLKSIAANQTEIKTNDKLLVFFSYETPVAFIDYRNKNFNTGKTNEFYSQTTTKHVNTFFTRHGYDPKTVGQVPQNKIDKLIK